MLGVGIDAGSSIRPVGPSARSISRTADPIEGGMGRIIEHDIRQPPLKGTRPQDNCLVWCKISAEEGPDLHKKRPC